MNWLGKERKKHDKTNKFLLLDNSKSMKKIALFTSSFSTNGVSRNRITLAKAFLEMGYAVDFVVSHDNGPIKNHVPQECNIFELGSTSPRKMIPALGKYLRSEHPDAMIAASWPNTASAIIAKVIYMPFLRLVVSEHADLRDAPEMTKKDKYILKYFSYWLYKLATKVVVVSESTKKVMSNDTGLNLKEINVIYNPSQPMHVTEFLAEDHALVEWWGSSKKLLAVGRLVKIKDYTTLLKAFSLISSKEDVKLIILGEGSYRNTLQELIKDLGLSEKVRLPGFRSDIFPFYKNADLFILSSRSEGFGNVIVEALSTGTPVVSTNCGGPAEILGNGTWGKLTKVGSPEDLAANICSSLSEEHDKNKLIARSKDFSPASIAQEYIDILFEKELK